MIARVVGFFLIAISALSIAQTIREIALWESGTSKFGDESSRGVPIFFGHHVITVADDQPTVAEHSYKESDGSVRVVIDSRPYRAASRARVRRALTGLGRYFGWIDAWVFTEHGRDTTLWLARRIQPIPSASPTFEITVVTREGKITTDVFEPWQLGTDYRRFRATQFMQPGANVLPLSMADMLGIFPLFVLVFPIGTLLLGILLIRRGFYRTAVTVPQIHF